MKSILVTGYTGFVGVNLVPYLASKGFKVAGVGRTRHTNATIKQYTYDELPGADPYDVLIHLAGKAHDLKHTTAQNEYFEVNTQLTISVFDQFLKSAATDFIYLSSVKAAADEVLGVLAETDKPKPQTVYGRSKLQAEEYLLAQTLPAGKRLFILRPCMIHGPGNKGNLNLLYQFVKNGVPYPLAAFKNQRSLLSVNNLLFVINALIADKSISSGIYHIADDEALATTEIIEILAGTINRKPLKWAISKNLIKGLASLGDIMPIPLNTGKLQKLTESYLVSNAKIKLALGIKNLPMSAKEGLIYTALNF